MFFPFFSIFSSRLKTVHLADCIDDIETLSETWRTEKKRIRLKNDRESRLLPIFIPVLTSASRTLDSRLNLSIDPDSYRRCDGRVNRAPVAVSYRAERDPELPLNGLYFPSFIVLRRPSNRIDVDTIHSPPTSFHAGLAWLKKNRWRYSPG